MEEKKQKKSKYRKSRPRERILELLKCTDIHPTAEWIYNKLKVDFPNLSLATVYRNLRILKDMKLITELEFGNSFNHFDGNQVLHYHFICEKCKRIFDVIIPELQSLNTNIESIYNFKINTHRLEFLGICKKCRNSSH